MKTAKHAMQARIEAVRLVTPTVRELTLRLPTTALAEVASWQPGAHIQVFLKINGSPQTRHYSLLPTEAPDLLKIAVKRADPGRGGSQAMWQLNAGDSLDISPPLNHFQLDLTAPAYVLIAGGIGITPMLRMSQQLVSRGATVSLIYGAREQQELAFQPELRQLLGERLHTHTDANVDFSKAFAKLPAFAQAYVCGPSGMLSAVRQAWLASGRPEHLLRFETFGGGGAAQTFEVLLPRHNLTFEVLPSMSLLDAIEQKGVQAMFGCRRGECGLCVVDVLALDGEIEHRDVFFSEHEKRSNKQICVCVSRVKGRVTLDSAYRPEISE